MQSRFGNLSDSAFEIVLSTFRSGEDLLTRHESLHQDRYRPPYGNRQTSIVCELSGLERSVSDCSGARPPRRRS
jgi:hypothetical protein